MARYHFEREKPTFGGQLGASLGGGLGRGLAALAESKLDRMISADRRTQDKQKLVSLGIPEHEAEYLAQQDPDTQWQSARQWLIAGGAPAEMLPETLDQDWNITPEQEQAAQEQIKQATGQQQGPATALQQLEKKQEPLNAMGTNIAQALAPQTPALAQPKPVPQAPKRPKGLGEAFAIAQEKAPKSAKEQKVPADVRKRADLAIDTADQMEAIATEMLSLLETGNVLEGWKGGVTPIYLQNDETQQFEALSNELASLLASRSGVATNFKIKLAQSMKPNLRQSTNTQKKLAEKILETSDQFRNKAQERLSEYGVSSPKTEKVASSRNAEFVNELPLQGIPAGAEAEDTETGQKFIFDGKQWIGA